MGFHYLKGVKMQYNIPKKVFFQNQLFVGEKLVSDGSFLVKKSAIKNAKKFESAETAYKWINELNFAVFPASKDKEISELQAVSVMLGHGELHKFTRSKILLDRGQDSPLSVFVCPEIGSIKFLDDEYTFNLKLEEMYSTEDGKCLIDASNFDDWNLAVSTTMHPQDFDFEIEIISTIIFSNNFVENV